MQVDKRLRVAICGAGIGGLVCALGLASSPDLEVDIYEGSASLSEVGAGIGPWGALEKLGLDKALLKLLGPEPSNPPAATMYYRKSDALQGKPFYSLKTTGPLRGFHRGEFQQVLLQQLSRCKSCRLHCGKRLRTYYDAPLGRVALKFEDDTLELCDVLIGADGIRSAVRKSFLENEAKLAAQKFGLSEANQMLKCIEPAWSGQVLYRAVFPAESLRECSPDHSAITQPTLYMGKNAFVITYPISRGSLINFGAFIMRHDLENTPYDGPWVTKTSNHEIVDHFSTWEPEVRQLISCARSLNKWAIHCTRPLHSYVADRVVLVGDAAHAMTPQQGSGAGQAIEVEASFAVQH
ncbi:hypothetical protein ONZ45_g8911 [Pleurotus djamor]|nr:hypothetical protein ONZ45_g8911 [Pleurotus djamor]